ncbi:MAG: ABC transporter permease [Clostridiales bacterium]|nr:ABC transporter permease [Clostridiales bacterium]
MKIWRLTLFNLKKRKGTSVSLLLLIFIATLFLCIGLNIMTGARNIYKINHTALNEPDNCYICSQSMFRKEYYEFLKNNELTEKSECIRVIGMTEGEIPYDGGTIEIALMFQNYDEQGKFFSPVFTDLTEVSAEKAIYAPETLRQYGFASGDMLTIGYKGNQYKFQIAGFFQTTCFGIIHTGGLRFYLPQENYEGLKQEIGECYAMLASAESYKNSYELDMELKDYIRKNADSITKTEMVIWGNALECEGAYSYMGIIMAAILLGFSVIITIICLLVIRFRIHNTIETSMVQIGTLQALGFKAGEVISVYVLEYVLISTVGALAGISANYMVLPVFGKALEGIYGLSWKFFGHLEKDVCCLLFCILLSAVLSFFPPEGYIVMHRS